MTKPKEPHEKDRRFVERIIVEQARALWLQGLSSVEIGKRMGRTKNSIIGMAHRNAFPSRASPIKRTTPEKAAQVVAFAARNPNLGYRRVADAMSIERETARRILLREAERIAEGGESSTQPSLEAPARSVAPIEPVRDDPAPEPEAGGTHPSLVPQAAPCFPPQESAAKSASTPLPASPSATRSAKRKPPRALVVAPALVAIPRPVLRADAPAASPDAQRGCRWPEGDPRTTGFHFCGKPLSRHRYPYCEAHVRVAIAVARFDREEAA